MARTEILNGLSYALSRGQSLKEAMMSMYNSGYPKEEIEEAARIITGNQFFNPRVDENADNNIKNNPNNNFNNNNNNNNNSTLSVNNAGKNTSNMPKPSPLPSQSRNSMQNTMQTSGNNYASQKVSSYETREEKTMSKPRKGNGLIIVLVIILLLLIAGVIGMFLFQDEVADFLSKTFG